MGRQPAPRLWHSCPSQRLAPAQQQEPPRFKARTRRQETSQLSSKSSKSESSSSSSMPTLPMAAHGSLPLSRRIALLHRPRSGGVPADGGRCLRRQRSRRRAQATLQQKLAGLKASTQVHIILLAKCILLSACKAESESSAILPVKADVLLCMKNWHFS